MNSAIFLTDTGCNWSNCPDKNEIADKLSEHLAKHSYDLFDYHLITITCSSGAQWCVEVRQKKASYTSQDIPNFPSQHREQLAENLNKGVGYLSGISIISVHSGACR